MAISLTKNKQNKKTFHQNSRDTEVTGSERKANHVDECCTSLQMNEVSKY